MSTSHLSKREARRYAAAERRREWRLRWVGIARNGHGTIRERLAEVAEDAATLTIDNPSMKTEIQLALDEFATNLAAATVEVMRKQQEPAP